MWYVVEGYVLNREHEYLTVVKQLSLLPWLTSVMLVTEEPVKMLRLVSYVLPASVTDAHPPPMAGVVNLHT
jgi:hypothetical protein